MAANYFDQFDPKDSGKPAGASGGNYFDQFDAEAPKPQDQGGLVSDLGKSLKVGVQRLPGIATGLADLIPAATVGARPFASLADAAGDLTGFTPGKWADETKFSSGHEQGKQAIDAAWKDGSAWDVAKAYAQNPGYTAGQVVESAPGMVAGGLVGRALMGAGAMAGAAANATTGAAARAAIPGYLERAVGEKLAAPIAAGVGEGAITAGQQMAQYQGDDQQKNALASLGAGVTTGVMGAIGGRIANKLGLETAETAIAKAGKGALAEGAPMAAGRRVLGGMVSEAVLQEMPQSAQEQMWQNYAEGKDIWDGVARSAVEGAIAGGVMGAGANLRGHKTEGEHRNDMAVDAAKSAQSLAAAALDEQYRTPTMEKAPPVLNDAALQAAGATPYEATPSPVLDGDLLGRKVDMNGAPTPMLGNTPDPLVVFPDGTTGRRSELDAYINGLPENQQIAERARLLGMGAQPADAQGPWQEEYRNNPVGIPYGPLETPLADLQQSVRDGTAYTGNDQASAVRSAMEDAWLSANVGEDAAATPQARGATQVDAQAIAAVDSQLRTSRILDGLQNALNEGASGAQALAYVRGAMNRIGEAPLTEAEVSRARRVLDAQAAFTGKTTPANLPADRSAAPQAADAFADNASMESLIPEKPSKQLGINPASGPLSRTAAAIVDTAPVAPAVPAATTQEVPANASPAIQAPQAAAQPAAEGVAQASATVQRAANQSMGSAGGAIAAAAPAQAAAVTPETAVTSRPDGWQSTMMKAIPVARAMGIDPTGMRLADVVQAVNAADRANGRQTAGERQVPAAAEMGYSAPADGALPNAAQQRADFKEADRKRTQPGRNMRANAEAANPMRAFLGKHGVATGDRADFVPGAAEQRSAMVLGYGPIFRNSGKQLDTLAQAAYEEGFIRSPNDVQALEDLIHRALRNERIIPQFRPEAVEAEMQSRIDRAQALYEDDATAEVAALDDAEIFALDEDADVVLGESNMTVEAAMRSLGFTEQEIQDATATKPRQPQEDSQGAGRVDEAATGQAQGNSQQRDDQARTGAQEQVSPDSFGLQSQTEAELRSRAQEQQQADAARARADARAEDDAKAASDRKEIAQRSVAAANTFELGQDPLDSLTGQGSIFDARQEAPKREAKAAPKPLTPTLQTDTPAFKKWFADSKITDEAGKPRVVYHGTTADFSTFDIERSGEASDEGFYGKGLYFSSNPEVSGQYAGSGRGRAKTKEGGNIMPVYLSMQKPFVTREQVLDDDQVAQLKADGHDGIVSYADPKHVEYVIFAPTQVKSAIANTGAFDGANPDIRFSRKTSGASTDKNLVLIHNLSAENLLHADEIGGLAAPSLAIANVDAPLDGFGEITLIGDTGMATPGAKNPIFDADVYSPRFPSVQVKVDSKLVKKVFAPLLEVGQDLGLNVRRPEAAIEDMERNRLNDAIGRYSYDASARLAFANAVLGKDLKVPMKDRPTAVANASVIAQSPLVEYLKGKTQEHIRDLTPAESKQVAQHVYVALINKMQADATANGDKVSFDETMKMVNRRINLFAENTIPRDSAELHDELVTGLSEKGAMAIRRLMMESASKPQAQAPSQDIDFDALRKLVDKEVPREAMDEWLREQLTPALGEKKIAKENGRTAAYTLDNIVKEMTRKVRDAEGFNYGLGNARSKGATKFKNLRQIQEKRDRVVSSEQFEAARKEIDAEFSQLTDAVRPYQTYERDSTFELLAEAIGNSYSQPLGRALEDAALKGVPADLQKRIGEFAAALVNAPTNYFEAKPQRAVGFNEFKGAVIPSTTSPEVRAALENHGLTLQEYDSSDKSARAAAVKALADKMHGESGDVRFKRTQDGSITTPERADASKVKAVQDTATAITKGWKNAPDVVVVANMQDDRIPSEVRDADEAQRSNGATGEPEGFYYKGKVYLVASQLDGAKDVTRVLFHESLGHFGLRGLYGNKLDAVLNNVMLSKRAEIIAKGREYGLLGEGVDATAATDAEVWASMSRNDRLQAAEEVLAVMAQDNPQLPLVQRAIAAIRTWLRENIPGFNNLDLTNAEIVRNYLVPARNFVTGGKSAVTQAANDEARFSRTAQTVNANYTAAQQQAVERAFGAVTKKTLAVRAAEMKENLGTKLRQGLVDQFAPIKEVSAHAYMLARLSKGSDGAVEAALLYGKPFLRDGVADVNITDGGFAKVLASLNGEHDRFFQWVAAQRAERLKAEGRENLLTDADISALKSLDAGQFDNGSPRMPAYANALRQLNEYNEASLRVAKESGLIDQTAYDLMKDQPYVPFYRVMEEGDMKGPRFSSGLVNQQAFKKLKGGSNQLNADLLQNTLMNWSHLYAAAARNRAAMATVDDAERMAIAYKVHADTKGAVKVMRDGMTEHWMVEDPYLLDAITALHYTPSALAKGLAPFKRLLTMGVTINPTFKVRNLIRDSLSAMAQSDLGYNPVANVAQGWKAMAKDSQTNASMLASGGIIKFGSQEDTGQLRRRIEKLGGTMLDKNGFDKLKGQLGSLWAVYEEFGDRTENANRAALYERLIAKGHSHAEASFMARDLMDFSMSGKWEMVRFLTQTVPFLNARMQGLYKLGRAANEDPKRFAAVAGAVSLASLGLMLAYKDDEDWKKREDWDRDSYWWFKIGGTAFRIPKPFEVGSIGTLAERTAELMFSKEMTGKRFGARISDMIFNTFAMDPTPQAIKPLLDVYANKDSFSGKAIEGFADERLRPQDRFSERTSEVARLLGSWGLPDPVKLAKGDYAQLSPKQIDFLMRGYTGWLSTVFTTATDMVLRPMMGRGERPEMQMRDVFLAGNFVESLPTNSSRYVSTMYDQAREISMVWASHQAAAKSGDIEGAAKIRADNAELLAKRIPVEAAKARIVELSQQAKRIEGDKLITAEAKRRRLDEIAAQKDAIAKRLAA